MSDEPYEINEHDIEVALRYLQFNNPENATREEAIKLLQDLQQGFHGMAHTDPEKLLELKRELDERGKDA